MLKVLLVDDEHFILQGLKVLINWEKEGFIIAGTASDGYEALDFLKNNSVDLIIADVNMPVISGLRLLIFLQHLIIRFRYSEIFNHPFVIAIWNNGRFLVFYKIFRTEREVSGET